MVKNCCAVGCSNVYRKGSGIKFYRKRKCIAAVKLENWVPNEYTWICSQHFVTGEKSNNPLAPNYVPSIFDYVSSPIKRRLENDVGQFQRRQTLKRRRTVERPLAACGVTVNEAGSSGTNLLPINDNETCLVQRFADEKD